MKLSVVCALNKNMVWDFGDSGSCTSGDSQREAAIGDAPSPRQEDAVLALVRCNRSVQHRHRERGLVLDGRRMARGDRVFLSHHVEREDGSRVRRRTRAEQTPHRGLLLESEDRDRQLTWSQTLNDQIR